MKKAIPSLLWSSLDAFGSILAGIVSVLLIARIIGPEEFGLGSLALGFILILTVSLSTLAHDAIVRKPDLESLDVDTTFSAAFMLAIVVSGIVALAAPAVAWLFGEPRLAWVLIAFLPSMAFTGLASPLMAERRHALEFRAVSQQLVLSRVLGVLVALAGAMLGAGVWSMVLQQSATTALMLAGLYMVAPRRPSFAFSWTRLRQLLQFSHFLVWRQLLQQLIERLFIVVVGYFHGVAAAGYWGLASRLSESLTASFSPTIYQVALAFFARQQEDRTTLAESFMDSRSALIAITVPVMTALAAASSPLIDLLLGEAWLPASALLAVLAASAFLIIRRSISMAALTAIGHSRQTMNVTAVEGIASFSLLAAFGWINPLVVAASRVAGLVTSGVAGQRAEIEAFGKRCRGDFIACLIELGIIGATVLVVRQLSARLALESAWLDLLFTASVAAAPSLVAILAIRPRARALLLSGCRMALENWRDRARPGH